MVTGLRQHSLESVSRLLRLDDGVRSTRALFHPPPLSQSTLGTVGVQQGRGFIAFLLDNKVRWAIDVRKFAGSAALTVRPLPRNRGLHVAFAGARLPGTDVPADLTLDLVRLRPLGGNRIRMTLKLTYGGFAFSGDFAAWLGGSIQAVSPVELNGAVCAVGAMGVVTTAGTATAVFHPNWTLSVTGVEIAKVTGLSDPLPANSITFALVDAQTTSLFTNPPPLRTFLLLTAGGPWKKLLPPTTATPIGTLRNIADTLDVMLMDVGEDVGGYRRQALLTASMSGANTRQFGFEVGLGPTDLDGKPLTFGLRHALLTMLFDPPAPVSILSAAFMPDPIWGRAGGIGFEVAGVAVEGEFKLVTSGNTVTSVVCQPALLKVVPPIVGTVSEPLAIDGARLDFVPANHPLPSPPPANWIAVGAASQGIDRASFSDCPFALLRPSDLLWLGYRFANMTLQGDDQAAPQLVPVPNGPQPVLVITMSPQNIAERTYFEHVPNYNIPRNPITLQNDPDNPTTGNETPSETADEPPVASRVAGESRLAFALPASVQTLPLALDALLSWETFEQRVVPAALPANVSPLPKDLVPLRAPERDETAIELPYRLIISPSALGGWKHSAKPVVHDKRVELWHTRLGVHKQTSHPVQGLVDESDDPQRAIRAVWSFDYPLRPQGHQNIPFRMSLDMRDRYEIVVLSANFNLLAPGHTPGALEPYEPKAISVERLMLSSLGGWLRSSGAWDPPKVAFHKPTNPRPLFQRGTNLPLPLEREAIPVLGFAGNIDLGQERLSVEEWRHIASMGRDQYVRVVYRGHLFPCGHRASLVKITERKFQPAPYTGRMVAYLRQRMYIVVRQPERDYGRLRKPAQPPTLDHEGREFPFDRVRITTLTTPDLDDPQSHQIKTYGQDAFWPYVNGQPFLFHLVATDRVGQQAEFSAPLIFISQSAPSAAADAQNDYNKNDGLRRRDFSGQKVAFAESAKAGDTTFEASSILFKADLFPVPLESDEAGFYPKIEQADVHLPAVRQLSNPGNANKPDVNRPVSIRYYDDYRDNGFKDGGVFAQLVTPLGVGFGNDKSLGVGAPNLNIVGLSRRFGTVGGDVKDAGSIATSLANFAGGTVDPKQFFDTSAKVLGAVTLHDLIKVLAPGQVSDEKVLRIRTDTSDPNFVKTILDWTPDVVNLPVLVFTSTAAADAPLTLHAEVIVPLANPALKSSKIFGTLKEFQINLADVIQLNFHSLKFAAEAGKKLDVDGKLYTQDEQFPGSPDKGGVVFAGPLKFINELRSVIPDNGFSDPPSLDVSPQGVTAGYSLKLPSVGVGIFSLENISLGAALTIPFTGDPVRARFNFSERQHPFLLSVAIFGGGGFFATGVGADGVELIEASLEFGGHVAIDLGVASGGVYVMAGVYFKGEKVGTAPNTHVAVTLTGYFRAGGSLEVLGIISISMEFYLGLTYQSDGNKVWGEAKVTVEVHVLMFSQAVSVTCRREFKDPPFRIKDMLPNKKAWTEYAEAFA